VAARVIPGQRVHPKTLWFCFVIVCPLLHWRHLEVTNDQPGRCPSTLP